MNEGTKLRAAWPAASFKPINDATAGQRDVRQIGWLAVT